MFNCQNVVFKGVPLRIEIGPRDVKADQAVVVRRDTGEKVWEQKNNCNTNRWMTSQPGLLCKEVYDVIC